MRAGPSSWSGACFVHVLPASRFGKPSNILTEWRHNKEFYVPVGKKVSAIGEVRAYTAKAGACCDVCYVI